MTDIGPLDRTVRPPYFQYPTPEAARQRWPAPGTFPRVRLPADTGVAYPEQRFAPPAHKESQAWVGLLDAPEHVQESAQLSSMR